MYRWPALNLLRVLAVSRRYFIHWLDDYTAKYKAQMAKSPHTYSPQLALSYARAKATFLSPQSTMEVNIDGVSLSAMLHLTSPMIKTSSESETLKTIIPACPPPEQFARARNEVEHMLRGSLTNYITTHTQGNACVLHLLAGLVFGVVCILSGIAAILCQITQRGPKGVRAVAWPFLYVGFCAVIGCLHGVCIIVWMFGDGRQLRDYELARPEISGVVSHTTMMPLRGRGLEAGQQMESGGESVGGRSGVYGSWTGKEEGDECRMSEIQLGFPRSPGTSSTSVTGGWKVGGTRSSSPSPSTRTRSRSSSVTAHAPRPPSIAKPAPVALAAPSSLSPITTHLTTPTPSQLGLRPDDQPLSSISLVFDPSDPSPFTSSSPTTAPAAAAAPDIFPDEMPPASSIPMSDAESQCCYASESGRTVSTLVQAVKNELFQPNAAAASGRVGPRPLPFTRMTPIESDVIRRSNWVVVSKTIAVSAALASVLVGALWCVPTHHRRS